MKITTIIADDEHLARQRVCNLLSDQPQVEIVGVCKNGAETIEKINEQRPDLIYLDIKMKDMTGFEVLEKIPLENRPIVVFVTAFDEFALKAFDSFAFDYLLKPYKDERFYNSLNKIINQLTGKTTSDYGEKIDELLVYLKSGGYSKKNSDRTTLPIKLGNKVFFISFEEIKYIKASGYYAEIYTKEGKKHLLREPLTNLIEKLSSSQFARIHRSTIINIKEMQEVLHSSYGEIDVKMLDGEIFRVSKSFKKELVGLLGI